MKALRRVFLIVLALVLGEPVWAQDIEKGLEAYEQRDYATALREWRPLAEQGDAYAQFQLGFMYAIGQGVPRDYAEAVKWYRKAAEQGFALAQNNLGLRYTEGQGVPQDYAEAVKWFRKAAEQGHANAQNNLGLRYSDGKGVPQDYVLAHKWLNLAAALGVMAGDTTARDYVASKMTPAQIAEAQRLAREWTEAFEKGKKN